MSSDIMYSLINKCSVFVNNYYCFVDGSVSIGDVCIQLKKPVSPELVPIKYGELFDFKTLELAHPKKMWRLFPWLTNPS